MRPFGEGPLIDPTTDSEPRADEDRDIGVNGWIIVRGQKASVRVPRVFHLTRMPADDQVNAPIGARVHPVESDPEQRRYGNLRPPSVESQHGVAVDHPIGMPIAFGQESPRGRFLDLA